MIGDDSVGLLGETGLRPAHIRIGEKIKMDRWGIPVISAAIGLFLAGCTPTHMDLGLRDSLQQGDLSKIQYSLNDQIILRRELKSDEHDVTPGHEIKIVNGKRIEEVVFPKGSAGVSVGPPASTDLFISFESGSEAFPDPSLPFSLANGSDYTLQSGLQVQYQGKIFTACVGSFSADDVVSILTLHGIRCSDSRLAALIVDLKHVKKSTTERRVVTGRHVGEKP